MIVKVGETESGEAVVMESVGPHYDPAECNVFWGSHGCSKKVGHVETGDLYHQCGSGSEADDDDEDSEDYICNQFLITNHESEGWTENGTVRYYHGDGEWSEWYPSGWFT